MKAIEIISEVSLRLNDQEPGYEFITSTRGALVAAMNWALSIISEAKPSAFAKPKRFSIHGDATIDISGGCERFIGPYSLLDANGNFIRDLSSYQSRGALSLSSRCSDGAPMYFTQIADSVFELRPSGEGEWIVQGLCASTPFVSSEDEEVGIPLRFRAALIELMMNYVHMQEVDSVGSRSRSQAHWNNAMTILNVKGK